MNLLTAVILVSFFFNSDTAMKENSPYKDAKYSEIKDAAKKLAEKPYLDQRKRLPKWLRDMNYDDMRNIRFNQKKAIWRAERLPFQLQLFHPVCIQKDQVRVHIVDGDKDEIIPFDQSMFNYDNGLESEYLDPQTLFSGIRIHYPLNRPDYLDELMVFQGGTYFRALAKGLNYGLSARVVCVNTVTQYEEEFPYFTDFWILRPNNDDTSLTLMGLIDSPSLAGAVELVVTPGITTSIDVRAFICTRDKPLKNFGIAPLTSMFYIGENSERNWGDYRPEVHDSDGLLVEKTPEKLTWRPLSNDNGHLKMSFYECENPRGFGLLQRDRSFENYRDLEARYQNRPSVWVEPKGDWGRGFIELIELATHTEYGDNIVAFWKPLNEFPANSSAEYKYKQTWFSDDRALSPMGKTVDTYLCNSPGNPPNTKRFIVEFYWPDVEGDARSGKIVSNISTINAKVKNNDAIYNEFQKRWRVFFDAVVDDPTKPVELNLYLSKDGKPLTENWTYQWMPMPPPSSWE